jgi:hypothetical protein
MAARSSAQSSAWVAQSPLLWAWLTICEDARMRTIPDLLIHEEWEDARYLGIPYPPLDFVTADELEYQRRQDGEQLSHERYGMRGLSQCSREGTR